MTWNNIRMRLATADELADASIEHFDFTKLSAINTCPMWGIVRYGLNKAMQGSTASQALLAGGLLHECFSVVRLVQLWIAQSQPVLASDRLRQLFTTNADGEGRAQLILSRIARSIAAGDSIEATGRAAALECLASGTWVDDPDDTRRTYSALELSLMYYCQRWDYARYPVWISPDGMRCGVEIAFGILVEANGGRQFSDGITLVLTGRVDGLHVNGKSLIVQENKTSSRLSKSWAMSFETSHQPTGYMRAASLFAGQPCSNALIMGLQIPLPARNMADGVNTVMTRRPPHMIDNWLHWLEHTVTLYNQYRLDPVHAPMYTHSCNRYFSSCSLIPLCAGDDDERRQTLAEMQHDHWTPLGE